LAFQKPTNSNTLRQRHHTRLWHTDFKLADGKEVWVATASYDEGIEFAGPAKLPTHHIDPNIDAERSYIVSSLGLKNVSYEQVVNPQAGKNASGDTFFTDGKAVVTEL
jgi:undecaprenyl-diphosphatase